MTCFVGPGPGTDQDETCHNPYAPGTARPDVKNNACHCHLN